METEFNFKSSVCTTKEQSERLLALGLKKETADMCHRTNGMDIYFITALNPLRNPNDIPAWSLHRLIEMVDDECVIHLDNFTIAGRLFEVYDNLFDNIIGCIAYLIKEGYFNKEYLV